MDGLTISNSNALLEKGQTLKDLRESKMSIPRPAAQANGTSGEKSFADSLKEAVQSTNALVKESDVKMQQLATGKTDDIAGVMIAAEKADISMKLMTTVRNKIISAYEEIMKMQV
jgi:flagellar hook-basal body complex protein FliE